MWSFLSITKTFSPFSARIFAATAPDKPAPTIKFVSFSIFKTPFPELL